MDDAAATSSPDVVPEGRIPAEPRLLGRSSFGLAVLALVAYAAGVVLLVVPVRTPEVQDCGAPGAFLLDGRVDVVPDAEDRILDADGAVVHLPAAVADAARDRPCRERVAARAVPGLALIGGATVVGAIAFALEMLLVRPRRRARVASIPAEPPPPPSPEAHGPDWPA